MVNGQKRCKSLWPAALQMSGNLSFSCFLCDSFRSDSVCMQTWDYGNNNSWNTCITISHAGHLCERASAEATVCGMWAPTRGACLPCLCESRLEQGGNGDCSCPVSVELDELLLPSSSTTSPSWSLSSLQYTTRPLLALWGGVVET